jgi:glutamate/tyrosine decarboxylase-like PLP-dependent enzyme
MTDRSPTANGDVAWWRAELSGADHVSPRFAQRHAILLAEAAAHAAPDRVARARSIAAAHPRRALALLLGSDATPAATSNRRWRVIRRGSDAAVVEDLLAAGDLDEVLAGQPDLEQTWVPLHPDRHAKLVATPAGARVALRWPALSVSQRAEHQSLMTDVVRDAAQRSGVPIEVWDDYTVCAGEAPHVWTFTANLGTTVEDRLRDPPFGAPERQTLVGAIGALRAAMVGHGVVWQGFAPRNMFFVEGRLLLIDFEEVVRPESDPQRAAECLLWHRVFFADGLTEQERLAVFGLEADRFDGIPDDLVVPADPFEHAVLDSTTITWTSRVALLAENARLEGAHLRSGPTARGPMLFGHELGHFWGDFVAPEVEAAIFRGLSGVRSAADLAASMEVFEAAMEADILRWLRSRAAGGGESGTPYTDAAADCITDHGAAALQAARDRAGAAWYERLDRDPWELIRSVLFNVAAAPDADRVDDLIGLPGQAERTRSALHRAVSLGVDFTHRHDRGEPVLTYADNDELREMFSAALPRDGSDLATLFDETERTVVRHSILQSHPGYLAFPDSANSVAAVAGGLLGKLLNQNLIAVDRSAPAATFVEIQTVAWLRELAGYATQPLTEMAGVKDVGGLWTTGGHLSNHVAMLAALGATFPEARRGGLRSLDTSPAVIMSGPIAHYSHSDAAFHLGLGWGAIIPVDARPGYTTDVDAVEKALINPPDGRTPYMVVGVAGNCRTTGLDDLAALGEVCRRHGVWFHVDACHGGSLIFNDRLRARHLAGIAEADSISLDPHKGLFSSYPSSYVLFRDPRVLTQFSRHDALVMQDDCWDLGLVTPFLGSRGFESLATWMMLRHLGVGRLGELVESRQALVRYLARRIDATGLFIALNDVDFYRLAFVLCPPEAGALIAGARGEARGRAAKAVSAFTSELNTLLYRQGEVCFDEHTLNDLDDRVGAGTTTSYSVMAACPGNPGLTMADLDRAVDRLVAAARPAAARLVAFLADEITTMPVNGHGGPAGWND